MTVQELVRCGADVNPENSDGETPVWLAAAHGHTQTVRVLLCSGADVDTVNAKLKTPLWIAAAEGHTDTVQALMENGASVESRDFEEGRTPLWIAAANGHHETVMALLHGGACVDALNRCQQSPIYIADLKHHTSTIKVLALRGACRRPHEMYSASTDRLLHTMIIVFEDGEWTPRPRPRMPASGWACEVKEDLDGKCKRLRRYFLENWRQVQATPGAAVAVGALEPGDDVERFRRLQRHFDEQSSRLLLAAREEDPHGKLQRYVRRLSSDAKDSRCLFEDCSPVVIAVCTGNTEKLRTLLASGANANTTYEGPYTPYKGCTLLQIAKMRNDTETVKCLNTQGNRRVRRRRFECPLCTCETDKAHIIVFDPCGHRVCSPCDRKLRTHKNTRLARSCFLCRQDVVSRRVQNETGNDVQLFSRFCVQVP